MPLRDDLLNPIAGANPSGENLRYAPIYEKIKEARREDPDIPQGEWQHARKVASYSDVVKLTSDALAKQSKDLQLAVWLTDALLRREGVGSLPNTLRFLRGLIENFWDSLYPELEDGEAELRGAPLEWLGSKMDEPARQIAITQSGLTFADYKQSRAMGFEADAATEAKRASRKQLIEEGKVTPEEFDEAVLASSAAFYQKLQADLEASVSALDELNESCNERFGEFAPSFNRLRSTLEEVAQTVRVLMNKKGVAPQAPKQEEPEPVAETPASVAPPPAAPTPAVTASSSSAAAAQPARTPPPAPAPSTSAEPSGPEDAAERIAAIARWMRAKDVYNIHPFLILRGLRWGELRYNGLQVDQTMLIAPPAEVRTELKRLSIEQKWGEVVEAGEQAMGQPCGRAWLDLQRYVVNALVQQGDWFKEVATAIRTELRGLLTDIPQLIEMSLSDDTPTANPETVAWIRAEVLSDAGAAVTSSAIAVRQQPPESAFPAIIPVGEEEEPPSLDDDPPAAASDVFDDALALARSGQLRQAVETVSQQLTRERSGRGRFKRRMQLAHLFMASGRTKVAQPILEDLVVELDRRNLQEWEEGESVAYPLSLLHRCLGLTGEDPERQTELYSRICRLAPARALDLEE